MFKKLRIIIRGIAFLVLFAEFFAVFTGCTRGSTCLVQTNIPQLSADVGSAVCKVNISNELIMDSDIYIPPKALEWISAYNEKYGADASGKIIMTQNDIDLLNENIRRGSDSLFDMELQNNSYLATDVRQMIEKYSIPHPTTVTKDGDTVSAEQRTRILDNRNCAAIPENVVPVCAVITSRTNLTSLPTDLGFYDPGDTYYNKIQETELVVGTPVLVLHTSTDGNFAFVQSYFYRGWISVENMAYSTESDYESFRGASKFITLIKAKTAASSVMLDMGVKLPYVTEDGERFFALLPQRDGNGNLSLSQVAISKDDAVFGNLPLTMENYYAQAFRYLGTEYGWGGADGGVDCSGFVCAVFRTFGIYLPRNTGEQSRVVANSTQLTGSGGNKITTVITATKAPTAIYSPGHVMLYLGEKNGIIHIIHAPRGGEKVEAVPLTYLENITGITEFK